MHLSERGSQRKRKKKKKTNHKKKLKKGQRRAWGVTVVWNGASRTRREATSRHAPGPGGERGVQSDGREEAASSRRGRLRTRDSGGEATRVTRSDPTRGKGTSKVGDM